MTVFEHLWLQVTETDYALRKGEKEKGQLGKSWDQSSQDRQHGFLSAAQAWRESWALTTSAMASRADGVLDSEPRRSGSDDRVLCLEQTFPFLKFILPW